jgi:predicted Zn finger-like uncharacterized protein
MMMQCPRCSTRWRVPAVSPVANPLFKCGRCHHLFRQFPGATPPTESAAPTKRATTPESDTLEFIFPERQPDELIVREEPTEAPRTVEPPRVAVPPQPSVPPPQRREPTPEPIIVRTALDVDTVVAPCVDDALDDVPVAPRAAGAHRLGLDESTVAEDLVVDDEEDERHELGSDLLAAPAADDDPELDLDEIEADDDEDRPAPSDARRVFRMEESMSAPTGFRPIVRAIGVAVSGFAALALVIRVAPEQTAAWLSRLPIAGAGFAQDRNLASKVQLKNVQGRFQRLRNARRVFVISGDARNNSPMTIERIEVAGALYGLGGGELDQKIVTTGNRTALTDLSEAEIALLQRLDPAMALAPGETTPFLIVFLEPPRDLREFSSRVLTVRPTRRASTPPVRSGSSGSVG